MRKILLHALIIMAVFFIGTCSIVAVDTICMGTTGEGGKFVLDVANWGFFQ